MGHVHEHPEHAVELSLMGLLEHEPALGDPGVRDDQAGFVDHRLPMDQEVEVERSRPERLGALTPSLRLHLETEIQQGTGSQRGVHDHDGVEVAALRRPTDRGGLVQR